MAELQVLISAFGPRALERIASLRHDSHPEVEYIVGWQKHEGAEIPRSLRERKDFRILPLDSTGLCNNRNDLLAKAEARFVLTGDDDLIYTERHLETALKGFRENPACHFLTFKYESEDYPKTYPDRSFNLKKPPRGYFLTSMELGLNLEKIRSDFGRNAVEFNPAFGVNGTHFGSGEEDLLLASMLRKGMKGIFIPEYVCVNTDSTTSERIGHTREFIETKGAVITRIRPATCHLRMLAHAHRAAKQGIPFFTYCKWWLSGAHKARKGKVFKNDR